ncbi:RNA polymerase sigma factor [Nannocystis bainbridge]|uniref:Sigma-70 family RNA polymerase sigma factor n=1 Tax=Nannocystis bainbridge TaxID=2995303 RepID=A0ABT5EAH3_9BACT|nr:sigma-70 family RNA polymerase sigma factor [Nannocystis bainbridge]MDC0722854.1 sigma-70 family RNA polymerase sigma factor [Nannocystis bainbridge]
MTTGRDPDLDLLQRWRSGAAAAGNQLCRRFEPKLRRFFAAKVQPADVEEMVQQTWLALTGACRRADLRPESGGLDAIRTTFRAYLYGIARHTLLAYHRKNYRGGRDFDPEVESLETLAPSLSQQLSLQRRVKQLELALRSLPLELQLLTEARYVEELSGPELAEMFALPEGTVRSRLSRARRLMDEALERLERK